MRIAFDGTTLRPGRTGVGYYTEHLLHHIAAEAATDDVVVVSNRPLDLTRPLPAHIRVEGANWRMPRLAWMHTVAPRLLRRVQPDVVHFTNGMLPLVTPAPAVVTIHDMSLVLYPQHHPVRRVLLNRPFMDHAARRADAIITVSQTARREIVRHYGIDAQRVHVVTEAAAPAFRPITDVAWLDAVRRRYALAERFILYVGTIEPRKNLRRLLEGFARRHRSGDLPHQLVCVGPYGWLCRDLEELIERLGIEHQVRFTGYVPFADLAAIYNLAETFVFPSLYEGFGLPVIEAMACGTPVITGRVSSLVEVGGEAVEQVESLDAECLGDAMARLAHNRERRERMSALGLARSAQFSWQRAARDTLAVYRWAAQRACGPAQGETALAPPAGRAALPEAAVAGVTAERVATADCAGALERVEL